MKVSKVNHVKLGANKVNNSDPGIMYVVPEKDGNVIKDIATQIEELNLSAQKLYSPFNSIEKEFAKKSEKIVANSIIANFKSLTLDIIKRYPDALPQKNVLYKKFCSGIEDKKEDIDSLGDGTFIERIINKLLRKSLKKVILINDKKVSSQEIIYKLLYAMCYGNVNGVSEEEVYAYYDLVYKDYYKKEKLSHLAKSIELRDVKIQVAETNGEKQLYLSNFNHPKKKYIHEFIRDFSQCEDKIMRENMIVHIKALILLFFCGPEKYSECQNGDLGAWTWGTMLPESSVNFDDGVCELMNDIDDIKNERKDILNRIRQENSKKKFEKNTEKIEKWNAKKNELDNKISRYYTELHQKMGKVITMHYQDAINVEGLTESDKYWIYYFEQVPHKIFSKTKNFCMHKMGTSYLCELAFKEWISFVALKYVDLGKAVYHFAMPDLYEVTDGMPVSLGVVGEKYKSGITSFDYERIKAEENLTRALALHATFASSVFSNAIVNSDYREKKEDVLSYQDDELKKCLKDDISRNILMFFGGKSNWSDTEVELVSDYELVKAFREAMRFIRNSSYHYAGSKHDLSDDTDVLLKSMFDVEYGRLGSVYRKKYASNNVPRFYKVEDIDCFMNRLYSKPAVRMAQIPSFGNVLKKKDTNEFLKKFVRTSSMTKIESSLAHVEEYRSAMYFLLKEIYYYGFLQEKDLLIRFQNAVNNMAKGKLENYNAYNNFKKRLDEICSYSEASLGSVCQQLMTDYNMQNQGKHRVKAQKLHDESGSYEHFKMLLYKSLSETFISYVMECVDYDFLKEPVYKENYNTSDAAKAFYDNWNTEAFSYLKEAINDNSEMLVWYAVSHFLTTKQNNLLQGDIRDYKQFIIDIDRRENAVIGASEKSKEQEEIQKYYDDILAILEFVMLFAGQKSNELTDYFKDEDEYAGYMRNFIIFCGKKEPANSVNFKAFCEKNIKYKVANEKSFNSKIGIYYDGMNPILNRNVIDAMMFGNEKVLGGAIDGINELNICKYYLLKKELESAFLRGKCKNYEEQVKMREYQNMKNRVELLDISIYTEIINDYMAQLVSYTYLRERDLMYYQLGFYYARLMYGSVVPMDSELRSLKGKQIDIRSGAILYQICAMYTHDLPVVIYDDMNGWIPEKKGYSAGSSIGTFISKYCKGNANIYLNGLELFEDISLHDSYTNLRNYIDHMKYLAKADKSIMALYTDIYNGFFSYDTKQRKSVSFIFGNILAKYFVICRTKMTSKNKFVEMDNHKQKDMRYAALSIDGLESDVFNYTFMEEDKNGEKKDVKKEIEVRSKDFLKQLTKLLNYSEG